MQNNLTNSLLALFLAASAGCANDTPEPTDQSETANTAPVSESEEAATDPEINQRNPAALPSHIGHSDCAETPEDVSVCDWVGATDVVIVGEIRELRGSMKPMVTSDDGSAIDSCDTVELALEVDVFVDDSTDGALVGTEVTLHVGARTLSNWAPFPNFQRDVDGEPISDWSGGKEGLAVGDLIGFGAIALETGFTTSRLPLFSFEDDKLFHQRTDYCVSLFPADWDGASYTRVVNDFRSCTGEGGPVEGVDFARSEVSRDPAWGAAAICYNTEIVNGGEENGGR